MPDSRAPSHEGDLIPARCCTCGELSEPRPMGQTPDGWSREFDDGNGKYYCRGCTLGNAIPDHYV